MTTFCYSEHHIEKEAKTVEVVDKNPNDSSNQTYPPHQNYSPVAIILATCALVTAIGKALQGLK